MKRVTVELPSMSADEKRAFDWAMNQNFQSVSAVNAKRLAQYISRVDAAVLAAIECPTSAADVSANTDHRATFMATLQRNYGVSEAYADAAWLTLNDHSRANGLQAAKNYATQFGLRALVNQDVASEPGSSQM